MPLRSADMEELQDWTGAALALEREVLEGLEPRRVASAREAERLPDLAAMPADAADGRTDGPDAAGDIGQAGPDPERAAERGFRNLAEKVNLGNCTDPALLELRETLQGWFPTLDGGI